MARSDPKYISMMFTVIFCLAASFSAHASGDFRVCNPAYYNADGCLKAHNEAARKKNKNIDMMDLANHAVAAGDKTAAFGLWSLAARNDKDRMAMYRLGTAYHNGDGAPQNDAEAAKWFRQSADLGLADAQYMLGALYANGQGLAQSDTLAITWYQKAAGQNFPEALHSLGYYYYQGTSVPQDYKRTASLWRRAAEAGYAPSYTNYGHLLYTGKGVEKDFKAAALWTRKGAAANQPYAKYNLGEMYESGHGVPRDIVLAAKWYREAAAEGVEDAQDSLERVVSNAVSSVSEKSSATDRAYDAIKAGDIDGFQRILTGEAEAGDFTAQVTLGFFYTGYGGGPVVDFGRAKAWMRKAVLQKGKAGAINLDQDLIEIGVQLREGALNLDGAGNYSEALKWFEMAAALGNIDALVAIGDLYGEGGHGLARDYAAALKYYKRAEAIKATPLAAFRIGGHYAKGLGVSRNEGTAAQWFKKAADDYPEAELWLAQHEVNRNELRSAMYWLDRFYLERGATKSLLSTYDEILHLFYGALLPPAPAGWTAQPIQHQTTKEPVKHASLTSSDVIYPIIFQRSYRQSATGREYIVRVMLSNYELADKIRTDAALARRSFEDARRRMASNDSEIARSLLEAGADMYVRFGAYDGFSTRIISDGPDEALIQVPLNAHIIVRAETVNGDVDKPEDVESLKTALRATKFDLIKSAVDGHGYYKRDNNGHIYK